MKITKYHNQKAQVILGKDYQPNCAMINEFQSDKINCRLLEMEIYEDDLNGYIVDDDAQFLVCTFYLRNCTKKIINIPMRSFGIKVDMIGPYDAEDYFSLPNQFSNIITLCAYEVAIGKIVFIVSKKIKKLMIVYKENEDDDKFYKLKYNF